MCKFRQGSALLTARVNEYGAKETMRKYVSLLNQYWYDIQWFLTSCDFTLHFLCVILWYAYILQFYDFMYYVFYVLSETPTKRCTIIYILHGMKPNDI